MKYTIKDLQEGKCAVLNDGTVDQLNEVLQKAFPGEGTAAGGAKYYYVDCSNSNTWDFSDYMYFPTQSIKDFLEEEWTPKVGELVEVSVNGMNWHERIFICQHKDEFHCVKIMHENNFRNSTIYEGGYEVNKWPHIRQLKQPEIEITVKVNGKETKLSNISEETLLKIRRNEP